MAVAGRRASRAALSPPQQPRRTLPLPSHASRARQVLQALGAPAQVAQLTEERQPFAFQRLGLGDLASPPCHRSQVGETQGDAPPLAPPCCRGKGTIISIKEADLSGANLFLVDLRKANLSRANLTEAYLDGACLDDAILTGATLHATDLRGAMLREANLTGAWLEDVILDGADLTGAKNPPERWEQVAILVNATMPDGIKKKATPETSMPEPSPLLHQQTRPLLS